MIVDDHPLIIESYKTALKYYGKENDSILFLVHTANDCDSGYELINDFYKKKKYPDIVFLDIQLPPSSDGKILSGEDLGLKIKKLLPSTKIIVSTTFNDNYRIHSIFKSLYPDGFLIKNDITPKKLIEAIDVVINDPPYYTKTIVKLLSKQVANDFLLDSIDRQILYELSIGTRMKDLPDVIPLSIAGIEKRKRHLKTVFNTHSTDDKELLLKAKEKGFI
nr:response regulator [Psychroserpens algicola]